MMKFSLLLRAGLAVCASLAVCAGYRCAVLAEDATVPGHAILAKTGSEVLVIWDATPEVATIISEKLTDGDASARLERDALRLIGLEVSKLPAGAKTLTVRIIYSKTVEANQVYGTATFAGVERYAGVTANVADAKSNEAKLKQGWDGVPPTWIRFDVEGELPPR